MSAGTGIAHSERTGQDVRRSPHVLSGIQSWVAQPKTHEGSAPAFAHYAGQDLPNMEAEGIALRLILGEGHYGLVSPVKTDWDTLYADVTLAAGAILPLPDRVEERAIYVLQGEIEIGGAVYTPHQMLVCKTGAAVAVRAVTPVRLMLLGGAVMDGPRYIWWNFVASSRDRIKQAAEDWKHGRFAAVAGDTSEFVPLPGEPKLAPLREDTST